ncbi:hypothetical protein BDZ94DRAFT_1316051 [Collybia nuda]|uniref:Uncharacterized protein n=1 Tax=Collybia nuda TaxID=64659 RepID=A0A9P6C861_9AGAR|nr:hypothetical protein BDZ94DRAFT_1316051 [Collybia nuda]
MLKCQSWTKGLLSTSYQETFQKEDYNASESYAEVVQILREMRLVKQSVFQLSGWRTTVKVLL